MRHRQWTMWTGAALLLAGLATTLPALAETPEELDAA
jgi:hypothetical protein